MIQNDSYTFQESIYFRACVCVRDEGVSARWRDGEGGGVKAGVVELGGHRYEGSSLTLDGNLRVRLVYPD
jgi:hypothetical protein